VKVFISGLTGTGKNTIAKELASKLGLKYYECSWLLKEFTGMNVRSDGYHEVRGKEAIEKRLKSNLDEKFDKHLMDIVDNEDDFVLDSWTMPWLYKEEALRILLTAPYDVRVKRVMIRDKVDLDGAKQIVKAKDAESKLVYLQKYTFDITKDWNVFDLIVNTQYLTKEDEIKLILEYTKKYKNFFE